jgi:hypothetical protein
VGEKPFFKGRYIGDWKQWLERNWEWKSEKERTRYKKENKQTMKKRQQKESAFCWWSKLTKWSEGML